jgi:hypothetical protein
VLLEQNARLARDVAVRDDFESSLGRCARKKRLVALTSSRSAGAGATSVSFDLDEEARTERNPF